MENETIARVLKKYNQMVARKQPWLNHYQTIGKYIRIRKQNFTTQHAEGDFLTNEIFDTTAIKANRRFSYAMVGNLWPNGAKSFKLIAPDGLAETDATKKYFEDITRRATDILDEPQAGLTVAIPENMEDQAAFGICGLALFENDSLRDPISAKVWDIKAMVVDEGHNGFVNTIGAEYEYDVEKVVEEYGTEKISAAALEAFNKGLPYKIKVLIFIEPRKIRDKSKEGNKDMPFAVYHIDITEKQMLKESGYLELPVLVSRLSKAAGEVYGRSPGTDSLPDIIMANAMAEAILRATEKQLDPPLALIDDGSLGNEEVDTSAGALNVFTVSGRIPTQKILEPIFTVGDTNGAKEELEKRRNDIWEQYALDLLLDLNNDTRMTFGEAQIRNQIRSEGIGSMFVRQKAELFTPMIIRCVGILFGKGILGVDSTSPAGREAQAKLEKEGLEVIEIPESVQELIKAGRDAYKIQYITPAERMMHAEELKGLLTVTDILNTLGQTLPGILLDMEPHLFIRKLMELTGASMSVLRSVKAVADLEKQMQAQQEAKMKEETADTMSGAAQKMSQAMNTSKGE